MSSYQGQAMGIPPSAVVRIVIRPMTKALNPLVRKLAGGRHFGGAALVEHRGRRSGRSYRTPVSAQLAGDSLVMALTFGNQSDWVRNVLAAGGCSVRVLGTWYAGTEPELLSWAEAAPYIGSAFSGPQRAAMRLLGIRQFMRLRAGEMEDSA